MVLQLSQREVGAAEQFRRRSDVGIRAEELGHAGNVEAGVAMGRRGRRVSAAAASRFSSASATARVQPARRSSASSPARARIPVPRPAAAGRRQRCLSAARQSFPHRPAGDCSEKKAARRQPARRSSVTASAVRRLCFSATFQPSRFAAASVRGSAASSTSRVRRICGTLRRRSARMRIAGTPQISRRAVGSPSVRSGPQLRTTARNVGAGGRLC